MLDIKQIRKEKEVLEKKLQTKEPGITLDLVVSLDEKIRHAKQEAEKLKAERHELSRQVGERKQKGENADDIMKRVKEIGEKISKQDEELAKLEISFTEELAKIPNLPMDDVKVSHDKEENVITKTVGQKPNFSFAPKHHLQLNEKLHLFEFQRTAKTTGSGWPAYVGMGARLEWALINYMIDMQLLNGFTFWLPPILVQPKIMFGSGQLPKFKGQYYEIDDPTHPLYLIPTAEIVLNGLHYDEILEQDQLPLKYCAYSPCFRREAGAAGSQERGLIRIHQFNKVEMFSFCTPEQSNKIFEEMIDVAEQILQGLGLHYRLSLLVTGDMSFGAAKTVDVEVWLPGQNRYYEVSSISNCTDYQARRSNIRYKKGNDKPQLVHTLNGSGLATPRLMVALLENNQDAAGNVHLPPVLAEKLGQSILKPLK